MNGFANLLIFKDLPFFSGRHYSPDHSLTACVFMNIMGFQCLCAPLRVLFHLRLNL